MTTRNLLSGPITLSSATGRSRNVLHALQYPVRKAAFYGYIEGHRAILAEVVAHHLGTTPANIDISTQEWWRHGSFNLVVPIRVIRNQSNVPDYALMRFPLPYRVGEATYPGNSDEKITCEAATYAWLEENCPSVPIPKLYGFGLSTNKRFTSSSLLPWWSQWFHKARCFLLAAFGLQQPSKYISHVSSRFAPLDIGYLLIETVVSGEMLSESWAEKRNDARLHNLQQGLARIMVSCARIRLPRIGTFRIDDNGYLLLDNRPLSVQSTMHENEGLSRIMSRHTTFSNVKDFVLSDLMAYETRFLEQRNAIVSRMDAWYQMAGFAIAKLILPQLLRDDLSTGPFVFALTDLHRSNIFVDENWNITHIVDLEFACSWPVEFYQTPHWLDVDFIEDVTPADFAPRNADFIKHIVNEEELQRSTDQGTGIGPLSSIMQRSWNDGTFWVSLTLRDPVSFAEIFFHRILNGYFNFSEEELGKAENYQFSSNLFRRNSPSIIDRKLDDQKRYREELAEAFAEES